MSDPQSSGNSGNQQDSSGPQTSGGNSSRGRGGRGTASVRGGGHNHAVERNIGTIHGDLFTRRPDQVKTGTKGKLSPSITNYVSIVHHPQKQLFQYHVAFQPEVDSKRCREDILDKTLSENGITHQFDGMILYAPNSAMGREKTFEGVHPLNGGNVKIILKQTVEFSTNDPQAINVYNLLIRKAMKKTMLVPVGRHFFNPKGSHRVDQYGVEVWPGYETAIRLYEEGLMLCIENRWKVLRKDTVYTQMKEILRRAQNNIEYLRSEFERLFTGQTVITLYNNKLYRITRVEHDMSPESTFTLADGRTVTFAAYFKDQYEFEVKDLSQPLLVSEGKAKQPGEKPQLTYLIPELCNLTGITDEMRKDQRCMRALSSVTRLTPISRYEMTKQYLDDVLTCPDVKQMFNAWEFELDADLARLNARELEPERLFGKNVSGYIGVNAEWARSVKSNGTCNAEHMTNWMIIAPNMANAVPLATRFIEECKSLGRMLGMNVGEPLCGTVNSSEAQDYYQEATRMIKSVGDVPIHMMVIILNDDNKTRYDALKKLLCLELPVPSQCVLLDTLKGKPADRGENKNFASIVLKIMLQMNCKMGGAIWKVKIPIKKAMIVGYDLYTDSTTRGKTVGACVSSYDQEYTKWYNQTRPHENATELGANLSHFLKRALSEYYKHNSNTLPDRIFLYRDGVGDGQIPYVRDQEVRQCKEACEYVCTQAKLPDHKISLAFVVVTKKVNMRVFKIVGNNLNNPTPGTIVDTLVTRPERYDFYMVPQAVNQGTVTPVCYNILFDETGLDADKHQALAFKLCHLYYNWQGTVRVPAPCQYAHKLAFLVAQSLHKEADSKLKNKLYYL